MLSEFTIFVTRDSSAVRGERDRSSIVKAHWTEMHLALKQNKPKNQRNKKTAGASFTQEITFFNVLPHTSLEQSDCFVVCDQGSFKT